MNSVLCLYMCCDISNIVPTEMRQPGSTHSVAQKLHKREIQLGSSYWYDRNRVKVTACECSCVSLSCCFMLTGYARQIRLFYLLVVAHSHDSRLNTTALLSWRSHSVESKPEGRKHWTRVSLLVELISSVYPMAVPRIELRAFDMRGDIVTTQHTLDSSKFITLNTSNDDPVTVTMELRSTLICKQSWFCERLIWNPAESLVCDVSMQLNLLHQAALCSSYYDIRDMAIPLGFPEYVEVFYSGPLQQLVTGTLQEVETGHTTYRVGDKYSTDYDPYLGSSFRCKLRVSANLMFYLNSN
ncbi:hypothetical protein CSKR_110506 [Clonorchis sinensis]|uniref:Uncharacterized protein n=1 Tax=Clonorchis sinensis TaxID=79923 RepID=A0A3R7CRM2_CLOSI|nr:hypothetical protein CSKR_110506 [Clonorchis sinensis]